MLLWKFVEFEIVLQMLSILSRMAQTQDFLINCDTFYNNSCFTYTKLLYKEWSVANTDCVTRGGYLTSINSGNENEMLAYLVTEASGDTSANAWIGLDYNRYMQPTKWVDGNPITYSKALDYPGTSPLCIVITGTGSWRAFSCSDEREYICRKPGGSLFAIKMDSGQYKSIEGYNKTINSIPTTLVCRTDTYQTTQITWEYKPTQNAQWTDIQGRWYITTGISELNISNYGYYRCHVKSGGSNLIYTATAINTTITTQITTVLPTTISKTQTIVPPLSTATETFPIEKPQYSINYNSLLSIPEIIGVVTLIVCLILIVALVLTIIFTLYTGIRRQLAYRSQRVCRNYERPGYENIADIEPGIELIETDLTNFNKIEIPTATKLGEYFNLSNVVNQSSAVLTHDSDDYTTMLSVENQDINSKNQNNHYENKPKFDHINIGEVSMDRDENLESESKQPNEMDFSKGITISEIELRKQFKKLNYESEKSKRKTSTIAMEPENKLKNPIKNVLPYDSNRVILMSVKGGNNYINASYIDNYQFIATTHPMENTQTDFLTMVLQTEANLVVMLSTKNELSEIEHFISKSVAYWGKINSINNHPPFVVKTCDVSEQLKLIIQTITLESENEKREHTFTHMISTSWNNEGEELSLDGVVKLLKLIMAHRRKDQGRPIIIHCRDGIGKTGVLLTVLKAIEAMDTEFRVDICEIVQQLRNEKKYFVPTLAIAENLMTKLMNKELYNKVEKVIIRPVTQYSMNITNLFDTQQKKKKINSFQMTIIVDSIINHINV